MVFIEEGVQARPDAMTVSDHNDQRVWSVRRQ
jgi:hypothetical protein